MAISSDASASIAALAAALDEARRARSRIAPPAPLASFTLAAAYDVQDAGVALREAAGERRSGWKLGITSPVKQRVMGIAHPLYGRVFAGVSPAALVAPRTEPELAFGLAAALDPAMDDTALAGAVAWVAPALEITDSRYTPGMRTAVELVADNTSAGSYALGPRVPLRSAGPIDAFPTELLRNGVVVLSGSTADVLGHPLNALRLLAAHLAARGVHAGEGDIVFSGAITDAIPVVAGDTIEARLNGLGSVRATFA